VKVLFDTNVVLDLLLDREPFADFAAYLFAKVEQSEITGFLCATTITTIHYLLKKALHDEQAETHIQTLLALFEIAPVNRIVIEQALELKFSDFEDAVLNEAARHAGAAYIITRNNSDFKNATLPVYSPNEFINMITSLENTD